MPETSGPAVGISVIFELYDDVEDLFTDGAEIEQTAPLLKLLRFLYGDGIVSILLPEDAVYEYLLVI